MNTPKCCGKLMKAFGVTFTGYIYFQCMYCGKVGYRNEEE
jgi:hypothetical protein